MEKTCPVEEIIKVLGMKWNMLILKHLNDDNGKKRFNKLLGELNPISSRTLSKRLKWLEKSGLVKKKRFNETPPRVEYYLTPSGIELIKCFKQLGKWVEKYR